MKKVIIILVLVLLFNALMGISIDQFFDIADYSNYYLAKIGTKLLLITITIVLIWQQLRTSKVLKHSVFIIPIVLVLLYLAYNSVDSNLEDIPRLNNILFLTSCVSVALFEEFFFRIYLYNGISKHFKNKSLYKNILLTSLLFGLAHAVGFFKTDVVKITVLVQIVLAFGLGVLFQTLLIRFKNIALVVGLHAIINYLGAYKSKLLLQEQTETYVFNDFLMSMAFAIVIVIFILTFSFFLIRSIKEKPQPLEKTPIK